MDKMADRVARNMIGARDATKGPHYIVDVTVTVAVEGYIDDPSDAAEEAVFDTLIGQSRRLGKQGVHTQGIKGSRVRS